jgi:hypothetical protein
MRSCVDKSIAPRLPNWVQETMTGGTVALAVAVDHLRHRRAT